MQTEDISVAKGDIVALLLRTRDGGRMFMCEGAVVTRDAETVVIDMPTGRRDFAADDITWNGKRWEMLAESDHQEAPRKRGGQRRGR